MRATLAIAMGLVVALGAAASAVADPKVVTLGAVSTGNKDPVAACGALSASPGEEKWGKRGLADDQVFLDGALAACTAAVAAVPDSAEAKTWLARVDILTGKPEDAVALLEDASSAGNAFATYLLSNLLRKPPPGVQSDQNRAGLLLKQAANAGFVPAVEDLAQRYETGNDVDKDLTEALRLYQAAADKGDGLGIYKLGSFYQLGNAVDSDFAKAMTQYNAAIEAGEVQGYYGLGQLYQYGQGVPMDYAKAAAAYEKGADAGEPQSETALAYLYEQALGVDKDPDRSFALLSDAADQGYNFGEAALSLYYLFGQSVEKDYQEAMVLADAAEEAKVTYAHGIVGYIFAEGLGTPRDLGNALGHFQNGSDGGDQYSTDRLAVTKLEIACADAAGSSHENGSGGHGVEFEAIDPDTAISACKAALDANQKSVGDGVWLGRAYAKAGQYQDAVPLLKAGIDAGNSLARTTYADMLMAGSGVEADPKAAVALYQLAADDYFAPAEYGLGLAYAAGNGVAADPKQAQTWLKEAANAGFTAADEQLAQIATPEETTSSFDLTGFGHEGLKY